jgi:hypothetical protein
MDQSESHHEKNLTKLGMDGLFEVLHKELAADSSKLHGRV